MSHLVQSEEPRSLEIQNSDEGKQLTSPSASCNEPDMQEVRCNESQSVTVKGCSCSIKVCSYLSYLFPRLPVLCGTICQCVGYNKLVTSVIMHF